ncbi:sensor histidine kinase [Pseudohalioglobus lutimaris]|nr:histidine kinase [Pseudohalioglobus lutimaris]
MQSAQADREKETVAAELGEFFIPDLCASRPVLMMVLVAQLLVMVYALASSALPDFDWELLAICSLFVQWVVLASALLLCLSRGPLSRLSLVLATTISLSLIALVTAASSVLALTAFPWLTGETQGGWWVLRNLLVSLVIGGIILRYFFLQQQLLRQEQMELQSRLDSLRARIRPHFLFNTLNSIASLIMSRPESAEQAVEDLAELFRASLKESRGVTTVADELRLCELYLGIEQLRLGDRLHIDWQVDPTLLDEPMPSLVLQPLVENAVYHGIARLPEGGSIIVVLDREGETIRAMVENPVPPGIQNSGGNQMALTNVEQRLQVIYGPDAGLQVEPAAQSFRVALRYSPGQLR